MRTLESAITKAHVEELVDTGAVQLGPEFLPSDAEFDALMKAGHKGHWGNYQTTHQEIKDAYPRALDIAERVLVTAGYLGVARAGVALTRKVQQPFSKDDDWHRDFSVDDPTMMEPERDGFTILASRAHGDGVNQLLTAGRQIGDCPALDPDTPPEIFRSFDYGDGPIIITQKGFAFERTPNGPNLGQTWHTGLRSVEADFTGIDFRLIRRPVTEPFDMNNIC